MKHSRKPSKTKHNDIYHYSMMTVTVRRRRARHFFFTEWSLLFCGKIANPKDSTSTLRNFWKQLSAMSLLFLSSRLTPHSFVMTCNFIFGISKWCMVISPKAMRFPAKMWNHHVCPGNVKTYFLRRIQHVGAVNKVSSFGLWGSLALRPFQRRNICQA